MKTFYLIACLANFALVFVWTFTERLDLSILNGVSAILCAIWATQPLDSTDKRARISE